MGQLRYDTFLRAMQNAGGGYVTDHLTMAITGWTTRCTIQRAVCQLRTEGYNIERINGQHGGYRLDPSQRGFVEPVTYFGQHEHVYPEPVVMADGLVVNAALAAAQL